MNTDPDLISDSILNVTSKDWTDDMWMTGHRKTPAIGRLESYDESDYQIWKSHSLDESQHVAILPNINGANRCVNYHFSVKSFYFYFRSDQNETGLNYSSSFNKGVAKIHMNDNDSFPRPVNISSGSLAVQSKYNQSASTSANKLQSKFGHSSSSKLKGDDGLNPGEIIDPGFDTLKFDLFSSHSVDFYDAVGIGIDGGSKRKLDHMPWDESLPASPRLAMTESTDLNDLLLSDPMKSPAIIASTAPAATSLDILTKVSLIKYDEARVAPSSSSSSSSNKSSSSQGDISEIVGVSGAPGNGSRASDSSTPLRFPDQSSRSRLLPTTSGVSSDKSAEKSSKLLLEQQNYPQISSIMSAFPAPQYSGGYNVHHQISDTSKQT